MATSAVGSTGVIDVASMVQQLMDVERQPEAAMQKRKATSQLAADAVSRLRSSMESLRSSSSSLLSTGLGKFSTTSSNAAAASATASATAAPGSLSFTVDRLASAYGVRTGVGVGSSSSSITSASVLALSTTSSALGVSTIQATSAVAPATYSLAVTQATSGAVRTGTAALGASTTISGGSATFGISVDGSNKTVTIASGTYTQAGLVAAVQTGLDNAGAAVKASLDASGRLRLTSVHEGSAASLRITNANSTLALANDSQAVTGTDGVISVGATSVTVTSAGLASDTTSIAVGGGTMTLGLTGGLRVGTAKVVAVSTGDRSLDSVVSAINGAGVGATAAAVKTSNGTWVMQATSSSTGSASKLTLDNTAFAGAGGLVQTSAGQDAQITVGSGAGAYSLTASGNTFSNVLPGVTIQANSVSSTAVQIDVRRDTDAIADAMDAFVRSVNSTLADINLQTKYDPATKKASPLTANATVKRMADDLRRAIGTTIPGVGSGSPSQAGVSIAKDGTVAFDRDKFISAITADPTLMQKLIGRNGTATSSSVTFNDATDATKAGSYAVVVTQAATQAQTGTLINGTPGRRTVGVTMGTTTVTYDVQPSDQAADVAAGLNAALAKSGLAIDVSVVNNGIKLTSGTYGSKGSFSVNTDVGGGGSYVSYAGQDVQGTIDGQAAVGSGTTLRMVDVGTQNSRGISLTIAPGATGALGTVTYTPGIVARTQLMAASSLAEKGALATAKSTYDTRIAMYATQIDRFEARMVQKEAGMKRQWSTVQGVLSTLTSQSNWLASKTG